MDSSLELYLFPECPYCQRVMRVAAEVGAIDDITFKNTHEDPEADRTLRAVGGNGQVPCLFIDGEPLYESDDIIAWLRENYAQRK